MPEPPWHIPHLPPRPMPRPRSALQALKCPISPSCTADGARGCACPVCRKLCRQVMHRLACRICAHQSNLALSSIMFWWMARRRLPGILSSPRKHWIEQAALPAHSLTASRIVSTSAPHPSPSHTTPCHVPCHSKSCNYVSSSPPLDCG